LRLISNKVTLRSYSYFLKFSYFLFLEKLSFPTMSKTAKFGNKIEGILRVKGASRYDHWVERTLDKFPLMEQCRSPLKNTQIQEVV
jgi:hypothetical protein